LTLAVKGEEANYSGCTKELDAIEIKDKNLEELVCNLTVSIVKRQVIVSDKEQV